VAPKARPVVPHRSHRLHLLRSSIQLEQSTFPSGPCRPRRARRGSFAMDFALTPELADLRRRVRAFMDEHVLPNERRVVDEDRTKNHDTLQTLQNKARREGLWTPHLPKEWGGLGLGT